MNKVISGMGFHHIALRANDFEKSMKFYQGLGMELVCTWGQDKGRGAMLDLGDGGILELYANGTDEPSIGRFFHLAIKVDDVDFAFKKALELGAKEKIQPKEMEIKSEPRPLPIKMCFVYGPDDEEIEFFKNLD